MGLFRTSRPPLRKVKRRLRLGVGGSPSSNVTVALVGILIGTAAGTVQTPDRTVALTGTAITAVQGSVINLDAPPTFVRIRRHLPPDLKRARIGLEQLGGRRGPILYRPIAGTITGVNGLTAIGTLSPVLSHPLTGVAATSARGTATPSLTLALTGLQATGGQGAITTPQDVVAALTGTAATTGTGTFLIRPAVPITGVQATTATGALSPHVNATIGLTGVQATTSTGQILIPIEGEVRYDLGPCTIAQEVTFHAHTTRRLHWKAKLGARET